MKRTLLSILILGMMFFTDTLHAQELKCDIRVSANQVSGTDRTVFQNMQTALYTFINNTKWTNINFKTTEKIECSIAITIRAAVPWGVLPRNYVDQNFYFDYMDGQPLDFSINMHMSDLTSTLAFYVYMFLGLDFDTFSPNGGTPFFEAAQTIVNNAQSSSQPGWKAFDGNKNRYWMAENLNNNAYAPLRQFLYQYHRLGLDVMSEHPDEGRAAILQALDNLQTVYNSYPTCFFLQLLIEAKRDEIINVFSEGTQQEKTKATNIMKQIDPSKSSQYDAILQGGNKRG